MITYCFIYFNKVRIGILLYFLNQYFCYAELPWFGALNDGFKKRERECSHYCNVFSTSH